MKNKLIHHLDLQSENRQLIPQYIALVLGITGRTN
jgi:hypothetical protein